jgi:hypothetical protein
MLRNHEGGQESSRVSAQVNNKQNIYKKRKREKI